MNAFVAIARCTRPLLRHRHHPTIIFNLGRSIGSTSPLHNHDKRRPLPVAAFIDLDNVTPKTHRRSDASNFISPLIEFERHVNNKRNKNCLEGLKSHLLRIEAFGNLSTRSWRSGKEKEHDVTRQEYIPWSSPESDNYGPRGVAQSGLDENGILRCGVCGSKMKLTKKDKKRNLTLSDKLKQHMKIHTSEQRKRLGKMKQLQQTNKNKSGKNKQKLLNEKDRTKFDKYEAATVGLMRMKQVGVNKRGQVKVATRNDLFRVLRELGVRVKSEDDVDEALISAADRWMDDVGRRYNKEEGGWGKYVRHGLSDVEEKHDDHDDDGNFKGILLVYSRDGDFVPLLKRARKNGFLAVSATDSERQTAKVLQHADVVLGNFGRWLERGAGNPVSSFSNQTETLISSEDENDNDEDEKFEIRKISSAPFSLLSASTSSASSSLKDYTSSAGVVAVPVSEDGFRFMRERQRLQAREISGNENHELSVKWDLTANAATSGSKDASDEIEMETYDRSTTAVSDEQVVASIDPTFKKNMPKVGVSRNESFTDDGKERKKPMSPEHEANVHNNNSHAEFSDRNNEKWRRRYQCRICRHQMKRWGAFMKHRFNCSNCTKSNRKLGRKQSEVYIDENGSAVDHDSFIAAGGSLRNKRNKQSSELKEGNAEQPAPKQENREHKGDDSHNKDDDDDKVYTIRGRHYKCNECGYQEKKWLKLTKYRLNCTNCTPKNRKLGIKSFLVLPYSYDSAVDLLPQMHTRRNTAGGIDMHVWTNKTLNDDVTKKESH